MKSLTHLKTTPPRCCTALQAWEWARCLAELAVIYGDDDARRWLPIALDHALAAERAAR